MGVLCHFSKQLLRASKLIQLWKAVFSLWLVQCFLDVAALYGDYSYAKENLVYSTAVLQRKNGLGT